MLVSSIRVIQYKKSSIILGLLSGSTPSFCWVVLGGGKRRRDESVNAAMGIIAICCENKMKCILCQSCLIFQQVAYKTATRLSLLELYISLFLFAII